jgi:hypothetical protein
LKSEDVSLPHAVSGGDNNDTSYGIGLSRGYSYASITGLPTCLSKTVEIWVVADFYENTLPPCDPDCECATNPGCVLNCCDTTHPEDTCYSPTGCHDCCGGCSYVFDNNGDGDFGDGTWGQIVSELVTDGGSTQKYRVGSLSAAPALPPEPGYPSKIQCQDNATGRGYFVTDGVGVVKWQTKFRD